MERFRKCLFGPYDLVSHGAGDRRLTHRCPGEWMTVEQIKTVLRLMVREMSYEVPAQDLTLDLTRIPALPASRLPHHKGSPAPDGLASGFLIAFRSSR
jgi:fatty-acid peroxygenase